MREDQLGEGRGLGRRPAPPRDLEIRRRAAQGHGEIRPDVPGPDRARMPPPPSGRPAADGRPRARHGRHAAPPRRPPRAPSCGSCPGSPQRTHGTADQRPASRQLIDRRRVRTGELAREPADGGPGGMHLGHPIDATGDRLRDPPTATKPARIATVRGYGSAVMSEGGATAARADGTVHVVGAGPVGLFLAALLQSIDGQRVRLYEKRAEYTRTRMVQLAAVPRRRLDRELSGRPDRRAERRGDLRPDRARDPAGLSTDHRPGPARAARCVDARIRPAQHDRAVAERADRRPRHRDRRADRGRGRRRRGARDRWSPATSSSTAPARGPSSATSLVPGGDPTARPEHAARFRLEYALVVTFLYDQHYACNEYCKYYKNLENPDLQVHPGRPPHLLRRRRSRT